MKNIINGSWLKKKLCRRVPIGYEDLKSYTDSKSNLWWLFHLVRTLPRRLQTNQIWPRTPSTERMPNDSMRCQQCNICCCLRRNGPQSSVAYTKNIFVFIYTQQQWMINKWFFNLIFQFVNWHQVKRLITMSLPWNASSNDIMLFCTSYKIWSL